MLIFRVGIFNWLKPRNIGKRKRCHFTRCVTLFDKKTTMLCVHKGDAKQRQVGVVWLGGRGRNMNWLWINMGDSCIRLAFSVGLFRSLSFAQWRDVRCGCSINERGRKCTEGPDNNNNISQQTSRPLLLVWPMLALVLSLLFYLFNSFPLNLLLLFWGWFDYGMSVDGGKERREKCEICNL